MAELPPKVPGVTQNWPSFPRQMMSMPSLGGGPAAQPLSWVDEFLDFSSARRSAHRRSASESVAFVPVGEECGNSHSPTAGASGFEGLDDEQLMTMFPDDAVQAAAPPTASSSSPSSPSDQNTKDDEKPPRPPDKNHSHQQSLKNEPGEVDSSCKPDPGKPTPQSATSSGDTIVDPKRVKRILANRQSAQRSRVRKLQYITELERSITSLQTEVSVLSPRVAFLDHQRLILNVDNSALKQRIAALAQDKIFKDAHQEALRKEIERLRQVYHEQSLKKKMGSTNTNTAVTAPPSPPPPPISDDTVCTDKDRLLH